METALKRPWLILLVAIPTLAGCALTTARVDLAYLPDSAKKSPLSTLKPMTIALQIDDQREIGERDKVGNKKNGFGMVTAPVVSNREVTAVVYNALKNELENNGHKVVAVPTESRADLTITARLKKYWCDFAIHLFDIEMTGTVIAEVAVVSPQNNTVLGQKVVNGTFTESRQIALDGAFEGVLNGALGEFVRTFSRDPTLLDALRRVAPKPASGG